MDVGGAGRRTCDGQEAVAVLLVEHWREARRGDVACAAMDDDAGIDVGRGGGLGFVLHCYGFFSECASRVRRRGGALVILWKTGVGLIAEGCLPISRCAEPYLIAPLASLSDPSDLDDHFSITEVRSYNQRAVYNRQR